MLNRRTLLATGAALLAAPRLGQAQTVVGVTSDEIKVGSIMPYSGPASSYGVIGRLQQAFFKSVNDAGGISGRKINLISLDDGYAPPRTVEQTRRLVEQDRVAFLFNTLGTPGNSAIHRYVNQRRVPHLFLATGADKWGDPQNFPWTIGYQPSYRTEAQIYAKYMLEQHRGAKLAILFQNDDFGKDYIAGIRDVLGNRFDSVVKTASHEVTDATIDSQVVQLQAGGSDVLLTATTPKFAAQTIRRVHDIGWRLRMHFMTNVSISVGAVMNPAGPEKGIGILTSAYLKDHTDPAWQADPGMNEWREWMAKNMPGADLTDGNYPYSYGVSKCLMQVLTQCNGDFSRENIMKQAASLRNVVIPTLINGITVSTSASNFHPIRRMQLAKWDGKTWDRFGGLIEGANV
jgi:branched-chain amino acid transport system substrate-binding protein